LFCGLIFQILIVTKQDQITEGLNSWAPAFFFQFTRKREFAKNFYLKMNQPTASFDCLLLFPITTEDSLMVTTFLHGYQNAVGRVFVFALPPNGLCDCPKSIGAETHH